jgi:hypothetical protein
MTTTTKPMAGDVLVSCLAGEAFIHPAIALETIRENSEVLIKVRQYGRGLATYDEVREIFLAYC